MKELEIIIEELQALRKSQEELTRVLIEVMQKPTKTSKQYGEKDLEKASIEERDAEFKKQCWYTFKDQLSTNTIKDFYSYWAERSSNSKKMRFEMEKVFDINRRMQTWLKNNNKVMPSNNTGANGFNIGN